MAPPPAVAAQVAKSLDPAPAPAAKEPVYVLLLGDDHRPGQGRQRSDTMMLARVDTVKKNVLLLSIPRDTRIEIPGHGIGKINAAYAYGGPALAITAVKKLTGLPVNHFAEIDFQGLTDVVDSMGGLMIDVDREINDEYRAKYHNGVAHISKGYQRLNGAQALTFVRSRAFPEGDFIRVMHQRQFLMALAKQAMSASQVAKLPAIMDAASQHMTTDMALPDLMAFAREIRGIPEKSFIGRTVPGKGEMIKGGWYLVPDPVRSKQLFEAVGRGEVPTGPVDTSYQ
jgi:LCP family protein required for cell wall assembly